MEADIKETTNRVRKMEKENIRGKMEVTTLETGLIIRSLDLGCTYGPTVGHTKVIGSITKCTAEVPTLGKTVENIRANISLIKSMDLVHILGKTVGNMSESGKIASATAAAR